MSYCLCCNASLLQHVHHGSLYWYCPRCRQAMPEATANLTESSDALATVSISASLEYLTRPVALV